MPPDPPCARLDNIRWHITAPLLEKNQGETLIY